MEKDQTPHSCGLSHFRLHLPPGQLDAHPPGQRLKKERQRKGSIQVKPQPQASHPQESNPRWGWSHVNKEDSPCLRFLGWSYGFIYTVYFSDFPKCTAGARQPLAQRRCQACSLKKEGEAATRGSRAQGRLNQSPGRNPKVTAAEIQFLGPNSSGLCLRPANR